MEKLSDSELGLLAHLVQVGVETVSKQVLNINSSIQKETEKRSKKRNVQKARSNPRVHGPYSA